ncbi:MAG: hypothetical protein LBI61_00090 [Puniceicoccales bacterium]|jgi:hypothetical protein|nr:hypothetical protein [Puniceicoccales bacterium]
MSRAELMNAKSVTYEKQASHKLRSRIKVTAGQDIVPAQSDAKGMAQTREVTRRGANASDDQTLAKLDGKKLGNALVAMNFLGDGDKFNETHTIAASMCNIASRLHLLQEKDERTQAKSTVDGIVNWIDKAAKAKAEQRKSQSAGPIRKKFTKVMHLACNLFKNCKNAIAGNWGDFVSIARIASDTSAFDLKKEMCKILIDFAKNPPPFANEADIWGNISYVETAISIVCDRVKDDQKLSSLKRETVEAWDKYKQNSKRNSRAFDLIDNDIDGFKRELESK